jgi:hypothetical protein
MKIAEHITQSARLFASMQTGEPDGSAIKSPDRRLATPSLSVIGAGGSLQP